MIKSQNYLLHMVSQIPSSDSPLNALLTRQNVESINEQTNQAIKDVKTNMADLTARIHRCLSCMEDLTCRERSVLEETLEMSGALKERLASLRTKSQQTSAQYLA